MNVIFRNGFVPFEPRARLIKLLGGELIRDEVMAVAELVKNAYDADASHVWLTFNGTSSEEGEIIIHDDGCGIDVDSLLRNWMQPAGSSKSKSGAQYTRSGRRMLGEKGVGRFAVDRLGRHVELVSRAIGSEGEIVATFDWDQFDDDTRLLSDVGIKWSEQAAQNLKAPGTRIRITGLRTAWKERTFRRLCARLQRLMSPAAGDPGFRIEIDSDEFPDYQGPLKISFLEKAAYRIEARFDGERTILFQIGDRGRTTQKWDGPNRLTCGPLKITINCFDLESEALARVGPPQDVRAWLREWSGISIYRDGFRVLPYGEPDDDWLRLDQRRVNNPVVRLSNNQVCGYIEIGRDSNPDLRDQTNRGGLLQNRAYDDLRLIVLYVLQLVENERQAVRKPAAAASSSIPTGGAETDEIMVELRQFLRRGENGEKGLNSILVRLESEIQKERTLRDQELDKFFEMAAIGHGAGVAAHTFTPRLKLLRNIVRTSYKRQDGIQTADYLQSEAVLSELEEAAHFLSVIAPSRRAAARTIDVRAELDDFISSVACLLPSYGVNIRALELDQALLRAEVPRSDFHQVLHILLWNSLDWLARAPKKIIELKASCVASDVCMIQFRDSGPGIPPESADQIFQPGFSLKPNGRGMGLAVARRLLARSGGSIALQRSSRNKRWTTFEISLKLKRSRSTPV